MDRIKIGLISLFIVLVISVILFFSFRKYTVESFTVDQTNSLNYESYLLSQKSILENNIILIDKILANKENQLTPWESTLIKDKIGEGSEYLEKIDAIQKNKQRFGSNQYETYLDTQKRILEDNKVLINVILTKKKKSLKDWEAKLIRDKIGEGSEYLAQINIY